MRLAAILLSVLVVGCGRSERPLVVAVPAEVRGPFADALHAGMLRAAEQEKCDIAWPETPGDAVAAVQSAAGRKAAAVVVWAEDVQTATAAVQRARATGVAAVLVETPAQAEGYLTLVAPDYERVGRAAAQRLSGLMEGTGVAGSLGTLPSDTAAALLRGFSAEMRSGSPDVGLLEHGWSDAGRAAAAAAADAYRRGHPDLTGLFSLDVAASAAVTRNFRDNGVSRIRVVAFRADAGTIDELRDRLLDAVVADDPMKMGTEAVRSIIRWRRGETVPKRVDVPVTFVDRGNIENPEVLEVLYPDVQRYLAPLRRR